MKSLMIIILMSFLISSCSTFRNRTIQEGDFVLVNEEKEEIPMICFQMGNIKTLIKVKNTRHVFVKLMGCENIVMFPEYKVEVISE